MTVEKVASGLAAKGTTVVAAYVIAGGMSAYSLVGVSASTSAVDRIAGDFAIAGAVEEEPVEDAVFPASASGNWRTYWIVLLVQQNYLLSCVIFLAWFASWNSDQQHWTWWSGSVLSQMTMQIANWENFAQQRMQWHSVGFGVKAAAVSEIDCLRELVAAALDCAPAVANSVMLDQRDFDFHQSYPEILSPL